MNIYTDGIFDLFHRGHIEFLNNIKKKYPNSNLIVGIINDKESTIRLIGKVRIINIKEGQTLKCDLLDINIENESFEADKGTEVFFEIEKTPK